MYDATASVLRRVRSTRFVVCAAALGAALGCGRAATTRAESHVATNERACGDCHSAIAKEWRGSLHRASHDDASYQRALAGEPSAFCNGCHAPAADPSVGVSCESCHARPHERGALADNARACASCHEFAFPDGNGSMQKTAFEHRASAHAATSCESCHMPFVGSGSTRHRSHDFSASRDRAMLERALHVDAESIAPGAIAVTLRVAEAGHAVPTGDMFRRLVVHAEAIDGAGRVVGRAARTLARKFERSASGYVETDDDRPGGARGPVARVPLDLGESAFGARIRWRVDHERVSNAFVAPQLVESSITVARGEIAP